MTVRVEAEPFDLALELATFGQGAGAIVTFTGLVRDLPEGGLVYMEVEHYPAMTTQALEAIEAEARTRWPLSDCLIIHRFGRLVPGAQIMMVATAAPHRQAAFQAAEFLMDYLKSRAPFWKKEVTASGENWVESAIKDEDALKRW
ncbi:MAG: molybdenum cofactor biosynthesis protein MoaE [Alphaproteobacteria bacterium]|nr:molybdenum cofactor biosynthesis protein MoaE [Alphaproteobacteria bacterium]